jgi:hypothetical protein
VDRRVHRRRIAPGSQDPDALHFPQELCLFC